MESFQHVLGYPECKNAKPIIQTIDVPCPKCGSLVQIRKTKKKRNYYICENNPESCDYISWNKPKIGEKWEPNKETEELKKTKRGQIVKIIQESSIQ